MQQELGISFDVKSLFVVPSLRFDEKDSHSLIVGDFCVPFGPAKRFMPKDFTFDALTCKQNIFRYLFLNVESFL